MQLEEKKVVKSTQALSNEKLCSVNLVAYYDVFTGWVDGKRVENVVYLDLSKVFDTVLLKHPCR